MPVLERVRNIVASSRAQVRPTATGHDIDAQRRTALFPACGNLDCKSGWLHLWRSRQHPVIEGRWSCSPECTRALIQSVLALEGGAGLKTLAAAHPHRVPLGLLLLSRGVITREQLRHALERQRAANRGRLGEWLRKDGAVGEREVAAALAAQWNCPVLSLDSYRPETVAGSVPALFLELCGALPIRSTAGPILYLAFDSAIDPCLLLAVEKMTGARVEAGILADSEFERARTAWRAAALPPEKLLEVRDVPALAAILAELVENAAPAEARIARIRDYFWLRMWKRNGSFSGTTTLPASGQIEDIVLLLG